MSIYNSLSRYHKSVFGAIPNGTECTFRLLLPASSNYSCVKFCLCKWRDWNNHRCYEMKLENTTQDICCYTATISFDEIGVYGYCFSYTENGITHFISRKNSSMEGVVSDYIGYHWELTCYDASFKTHTALAGSRFYQIFPDRFYRMVSKKEEIPGTVLHSTWGEMPVYMPDSNFTVKNNDFFGGDLKGITEKLPYLKDLGINVLYLMPICESMENHGYATSDYLKVNPYLGSTEDLQNLCNEAHKLGMYVMVDGVFSHTGSNSVYFKEAQKSSQSPYYSWYTFLNDGYVCWWGFPTLPTVCKLSNSYQKFIFGKDGVIETWFSWGIDGIRLDVVDELPDYFLTPLCKKVHELGGFVIGEVWENAVTKVSYDKLRSYFLGNQLDGVMNYPFQKAIIAYVKEGNVNKFFYDVMEIVESYPKPALSSLMNFASTHDTARILSEFGGEDASSFPRNWVERRKYAASIDKLDDTAYKKAKQMLKVAWAFLSFAPGNSCIFYGDEVGLCGYFDPFNRKCFPWDNMDEELLCYFREIGNLRTVLSSFLADASFGFEFISESLCVFNREDDCEKLLVGFNRSSILHTFNVDCSYDCLFSLGCTFTKGKIDVDGFGVFVLKMIKG